MPGRRDTGSWAPTRTMRARPRGTSRFRRRTLPPGVDRISQPDRRPYRRHHALQHRLSLRAGIDGAEWCDLAHLGAIDMVKAGTTTINDIYCAADGLAAAVVKTGLRAQLCEEIFDVAKDKLLEGDYARYPAQGAARLARSLAFTARWHGAADHDAFRAAGATMPHHLPPLRRLPRPTRHPRARYYHRFCRRLDAERPVRGQRNAQRAAAEARQRRGIDHGRGALVRHHGQAPRPQETGPAD